eukprot:CAMPEP_0118976428 /NCGR_PEP_ID=MMETSP1173-20130426/18800_1 /TAXON_ID=1034831 /ORGANISM="Rhizochromulina marina cf, Strain CCMP1243" /LENGTH=289 /DNA_ID=CAMNT_0006926459 /DNA_START=36 /DNA_END=902 /DNA_ORIENTATION=+
MGQAEAEAVWSVYFWCRDLDEVADGAGFSSPKDRATELERRKALLARAFSSTGDVRPEGKVWKDDSGLASALSLGLAAQRFRLEVEPFQDMIDGMLMDVQAEAKGQQVLYATADELDVYCYRVAGTVGLMTLPVVAQGLDTKDPELRARAKALGEAFQLTNILRDVGEDLRLRGRVYLPQETLDRFGVSVDDLQRMAKGETPLSDNYKSLLRHEIQRNLERYTVGESGIPMLPWTMRFPVRVALELYREILVSIEEKSGLDNLSKRAFVGTLEKISLLPGILLRALFAV